MSNDNAFDEFDMENFLSAVTKSDPGASLPNKNEAPAAPSSSGAEDAFFDNPSQPTEIDKLFDFDDNVPAASKPGPSSSSSSHVKSQEAFDFDDITPYIQPEPRPSPQAGSKKKPAAKPASKQDDFDFDDILSQPAPKSDSIDDFDFDAILSQPASKPSQAKKDDFDDFDFDTDSKPAASKPAAKKDDFDDFDDFIADIAPHAAGPSGSAPAGEFADLLEPNDDDSLDYFAPALETKGPLGGMRVVTVGKIKKSYTFSSNRPELWASLDVPSSVNPFTFSILEELLAVAIRKGEVENAIAAATEMYRMQEIGINTGLTELLNRLSLIAVEDIGVASSGLAQLVVGSVYKWLHDKKSSIPKLSIVVELIWLMCLAKKTRVSDHLWNLFTKPTALSLAKKLGDKSELRLSQDERLALNEQYPNPEMRRIFGDARSFFISGDDSELKKNAIIFYWRLYKKDYTAVHFLYRFMELASQGHAITKRPKITLKQPEIILEAMFRKLFAGRNMSVNHVEIMMKAYYKSGGKTFNAKTGKHPDRRFYLLFLVDSYLFQDEIPAPSRPPASLDALANKAATVLYRGKYNLVIKPYLAAGAAALNKKIDKKDKVESFRVSNEDMDYRLDIPYKVYQKMLEESF